MAMIPHVWEMGDTDMRICMRCPAIQRRQVYGGGRFGPWHPVDQFCDLGAAARQLADQGEGMGRAQITSWWFFGTRYQIHVWHRLCKDDMPWWIATFRHRALAERFCAAMGWEIVP